VSAEIVRSRQERLKALRDDVDVFLKKHTV
jgi:hypothetical protein